MEEARIVRVEVYPNQKIVTIKKANSDRDNVYGILNREACSHAARVLSDKAFLMYVFLNLNQDGYTFALSPAHFQEQFNFNEKRCRDAVKELIREGYLVQSREHTLQYTFYELPNREHNAPDNAVAIPNNAVATPISADDAPIEDSHPHPNGTPPIPESGREIIQIIHDNTYHNTRNNTDHNTVHYIEDAQNCFMDDEALPF